MLVVEKRVFVGKIVRNVVTVVSDSSCLAPSSHSLTISLELWKESRVRCVARCPIFHASVVISNIILLRKNNIVELSGRCKQLLEVNLP